MLDIMRRKKRLKIILWLVIFSLALGMLLFFVPGMDMGVVTTDTSAATVDGEAIPLQDYAAAYRRTVKQYSNAGRNSLDPEMLKAMQLPKQVLDNLISQKVVENLAERMGIEVTMDEIRRGVETHPNLQYQGKFIGISTYKSLLAQNDISIPEFEEGIRFSLLARKLRNVVTDSLNVSERELREEFSRTNQQTVVDYALLKKDDYAKRVKPSEADLQAYFDSHKDAYKIKERRKIQYLLVPVSQAAASIEVTEQEILAEWNRTPHEETVEPAHILFRFSDPAKEAEVKAKAEAVLKKIKAGGDFAELAKKNSDDEQTADQGGLMGPIQRTGAPEVTEFEAAAFSLKPGEISDLVRTQYGYHIIKVLRHENPTLESSRSGIESSIRMNKAQNLARQAAEQAAAAATKQKDLASAAKGLSVAAEIKDTVLFSREDNPFDIGISQALRDEAFALKDVNSIGKAVDHPLGFAVPKLVETQPEKPGTLALARTQVEKDYVEAKTRELMQTEARKLAEESRKLGSLQQAAKAMGLTVKTSQPFNISGTPDSDIGSNSSFNQAAFDLAPGGVSAPVPLLDDLAVMQVKSRTPFDEAAFKQQMPELRARMLQSLQEPYFQDYVRKAMEEMEKAGKIRINTKAVERMY